ncbi:MAG: NAD(P)-dependent alcohol dehydrogenase [Oscillospiraceae bacterium]|nr:NAD(P)-dependent alcohol dehydrogenase [Oscillospiraceae bacterium]
MVTREANQYALETVELDDPKSGEVRVKIIACGLCHTDIAAMAQFIPMKLPGVMGHEGVGVVDAVGPNVKELQPGDRVILSFPSCGCCNSCRSGRPYACKDSYPLYFSGAYQDGTRRLHQGSEDISALFGQGAFAEYAIVAERNAVKVDVDTDEELIPLCSLGCGIQTGAGTVINRIKPEAGSSIAVFGCGAVGMAAIMAAKLCGCTTIIGIDIVPSRLSLAQELGATHVINGKETDDIVSAVRAITDGGTNYSVECSGVPALAVNSIECLGIEGLSVIVSVTGELEMKFKPEPTLMTPCRTFAGYVEGGSNPKLFIPRLVRLYKAGKLPVEKLVKTYKFADIGSAISDSHSGEVIKPVLLM